MLTFLIAFLGPNCANTPNKHTNTGHLKQSVFPVTYIYVVVYRQLPGAKLY